jgi:hypothetical protein
MTDEPREDETLAYPVETLEERLARRVREAAERGEIGKKPTPRAFPIILPIDFGC